MRNITTVFCFFIVLSVYSQKTIDVKSDWVVATSVDEAFIISKRIVDIKDTKNGTFKSYYQFKFQNLSSSRLELSWDFKLDYENFNERKSRFGESERTLTLDGNETFIPDSYNVDTKKYFVFRKFLSFKSNVELSSVEFDNLTYKL